MSGGLAEVNRWAHQVARCSSASRQSDVERVQKARRTSHPIRRRSERRTSRRNNARTTPSVINMTSQRAAIEEGQIHGEQSH
jgi:hypothetical protein